MIPPKGWYCTRDAGHEGPCAAHPEEDESGWLIEMPTRSGGMWWGISSCRVGSFSFSVNEAVRFARKQDAEAMVGMLFPHNTAIVVTEHLWLVARPHAQSQA